MFGGLVDGARHTAPPLAWWYARSYTLARGSVFGAKLKVPPAGGIIAEVPYVERAFHGQILGTSGANIKCVEKAI